MEGLAAPGAGSAASGLRFALLRHPPVAGGAGLCYGRQDLPLADAARDIPPLVAQLGPLRGARIITSPLGRCRRVAEALAAASAAVVEDAPGLLELNFGAWEGRRWESIPQAEIAAWAADLWGFAPPGGEAGGVLAARVEAVWAACLGACQPFLLITHGGPLKVLRSLAEGRPIDLAAPAPPPGAVLFGAWPPGGPGAAPPRLSGAEGAAACAS
ncbi:histidine phosphatase family protein [Acidisoma sp. C75]